MSAAKDCEKQTKLVLQTIPSLCVLKDTRFNITYVWQNYIYYISRSSEAGKIKILEANIDNMTITNVITFQYINYYYKPVYIARNNEFIYVISHADATSSSSFKLHSFNLTNKVEIEPVTIDARKINAIIEHNGNLFIGLHNDEPKPITVSWIGEKGPEYTSCFKILVYNLKLNKVTNELVALNNTIYELNIICEKLICSQDFMGTWLAIWDLNDLYKPAKSAHFNYKGLTKYNNLIYPYYYTYKRLPFCPLQQFLQMELPEIQTINYKNMDILTHVRIINNKYYVGIAQECFRCDISIYNLNTHKHEIKLHSTTYKYDRININNFIYIYNDYIIITDDEIYIYKLSEMEIGKPICNRCEHIIFLIADKYLLPEHLKNEIRKCFPDYLKLVGPDTNIIAAEFANFQSRDFAWRIADGVSLDGL